MLRFRAEKLHSGCQTRTQAPRKPSSMALSHLSHRLEDKSERIKTCQRCVIIMKSINSVRDYEKEIVSVITHKGVQGGRLQPPPPPPLGFSTGDNRAKNKQFSGKTT